MARYMFDTNMCIYLMRNQPPQVAERFAQCFEGDVVLSAITLAELEYGVTVSGDPQARGTRCRRWSHACRCCRCMLRPRVHMGRSVPPRANARRMRWTS